MESNGLQQQHSERAHALLSASGASRWINCPPSARLSDGYPDETSTFAAEGTLAHEFSELRLRRAIGEITTGDLRKGLNKFRKDDLYTDEMEGHVETYVDYVLDRFKQAKKKSKGAVLLIEQRLDLTEFVPEGFGSNDAIIVVDGEMEVIDLKYGRGVKVSAIDNSQLRLYGLGALLENEWLYDIEKVKMTIVQPRLYHIENDTISAIDLLVWADTIVAPKAQLAFAGEGELKSGDHCRFCKHAVKCTALADACLEDAKKAFSFVENDGMVKDVMDRYKPMTDAELLEIYAKISQITNWLGSLQKHVLSEALGGKKWEGYKLVAGRSNRVWVDTEEVKVILKMEFEHRAYEFTETKLLGITKIEKLIGKKAFNEHLSSQTFKPAGSPILVEASDNRKEVVIEAAEEVFSKQENEGNMLT